MADVHEIFKQLFKFNMDKLKELELELAKKKNPKMIKKIRSFEQNVNNFCVTLNCTNTDLPSVIFSKLPEDYFYEDDFIEKLNLIVRIIKQQAVTDESINNLEALREATKQLIEKRYIYSLQRESCKYQANLLSIIHNSLDGKLDGFAQGMLFTPVDGDDAGWPIIEKEANEADGTIKYVHYSPCLPKEKVSKDSNLTEEEKAALIKWRVSSVPTEDHKLWSKFEIPNLKTASRDAIEKYIAINKIREAVKGDISTQPERQKKINKLVEIAQNVQIRNTLAVHLNPIIRTIAKIINTLFQINTDKVYILPFEYSFFKTKGNILIDNIKRFSQSETSIQEKLFGKPIDVVDSTVESTITNHR